MTDQLVRRARNAVVLTFFLNGVCFATWVSRIPDARDRFALSNGELGLLLLTMAVGSLIALPSTGALIEAFGTVRVVRLGVLCASVGLTTAALGMGGLLAATGVGLFVYGIGIGVWDVAMNVEGAEVERHLERTIMPRFHAAFSLGTVAGALAGASVVAWDVPAGWHLATVALVASGLVLAVASSFLPVAEQPPAERRSAARAWLEPRTLVIGVVVLALGMTEGTANDWLAVALVDGYDASHAVGVLGFGVFVAAMTLTRFAGTGLIDRWGRVAVLRGTLAAALLGVLLIVFGGQPVVVVVGIVLWGAGASLGFPVGMSAAADDPGHAAARVSVVSTVGYAAFLAGPPLLGFVADQVGTLRALLVVALVLVPAGLAAPALRSEEPARTA